MSIAELRKNTKRRIDALPEAEVRAAAKFVEYLAERTSNGPNPDRPPIMERLKRARAEYAARRGTPVSKLKRKY